MTTDLPAQHAASADPTKTGAVTNGPTDPVSVRSATQADDLDGLNAGNVAWMGEDITRRLFAAAGDVPRGMLVAEIDGVPVGYGDWVGIGLADGHRGRATVHVRREHRDRGAGSALWSTILAECGPELVPGIRLGMDADDDRSRSIALAHGLYAGKRQLESELDLTGIDVAATTLLARPPAGVAIGTLADDPDPAQWLAFIDVYHRLVADTPNHAEGSDPESYTILRTFLPDYWQVMGAWIEDQMVGFTSVSIQNASARTLNTHMTAVDRDFRGRGIATALKAAHVLALRTAGWRTIVTQNMEGNAHILASNRTLGFRQLRAIQNLTLDFADATASQ